LPVGAFGLLSQNYFRGTFARRLPASSGINSTDLKTNPPGLSAHSQV
jgi:hypothetical protein